MNMQNMVKNFIIVGSLSLSLSSFTMKKTEIEVLTDKHGYTRHTRPFNCSNQEENNVWKR